MDKLIELLIVNGPGVLLVAAVIFFGKNLIEYFFTETIELKKQDLNQEFEKFKLRIKNQEEDNKNWLERERNKNNQEFQRDINYTLKKYQIEMIKINRVLPVMEELSERIKMMNVLFYTYFYRLLNKDDGKALENIRVEIHKKLLEISGKIDIYIPFELKKRNK